MVHGAIMLVASTVGVWLFSVQHRFEGASWARRPHWSAAEAPCAGRPASRCRPSSTGPPATSGFTSPPNPRIPNYRLAECHRAVLRSSKVRTLTLATVARAWRYALWDEAGNRMCTVLTVMTVLRRLQSRGKAPGKPTENAVVESLAGRLRGTPMVHHLTRLPPNATTRAD